uniref:Uncharacterized protein n=1 Tax=Oryza punctata TaxID=4537 RepID=A0A0E0M6P3_ORYPU
MAVENIIEGPRDTCIRLLKRIQADLVILVASRKIEQASEREGRKAHRAKGDREHDYVIPGLGTEGELPAVAKGEGRNTCSSCIVVLQSTMETLNLAVGPSSSGAIIVLSGSGDLGCPSDFRRNSRKRLLWHAFWAQWERCKLGEKAEHCTEAWGQHGSCVSHIHSWQKRGSNSWQRL